MGDTTTSKENESYRSRMSEYNSTIFRQWNPRGLWNRFDETRKDLEAGHAGKPSIEDRVRYFWHAFQIIYPQCPIEVEVPEEYRIETDVAVDSSVTDVSIPTATADVFGDWEWAYTTDERNKTQNDCPTPGAWTFLDFKRRNPAKWAEVCLKFEAIKRVKEDEQAGREADLTATFRMLEEAAESTLNKADQRRFREFLQSRAEGPAGEPEVSGKAL